MFVRWKNKYIRRCAKVWVSHERFAVLLTSANGHPFRGGAYWFSSPYLDDQKCQVHATVEELLMRRPIRPASEDAPFHANPDSLMGEYPYLAAFLTDAAYEDGSRRVGGTITVWAQNGQWKASLHERSAGLVLWVTAEGWPAVLELAECLLASEDAPWAANGAPSEKGKKAK